MTLYELTGQLAELQTMLAEETDPEIIDTIMDTIDGLDGEIEHKADGYAKIMRNLAADVDGLTAEIERLSERKKALENNLVRLKARLQDSMILTGKEKFKTKLFSFSIQNNPASVIIDGDLPDRFLIPQDPKPDKKAIKEALQQGENLEGVAHLEQTKSLRIK